MLRFPATDVFHNIFSAIAANKPHTNLLPNLRTLYLPSFLANPLNHYDLFIHPSVTVLEISIAYPDVEADEGCEHRGFTRSISHALEGISRMPHLVNLYIASSQFPPLALLPVLPDLTALETVSLPRYSLYKPAIEMFSNLPKLRIISGLSVPRRDLTALPSFTPVCFTSSYPALTAMSFCAGALESAKFIEAAMFPSHICTLALAMASPQGKDTVSALFAAIAKQCPNLVHLSYDDGGALVYDEPGNAVESQLSEQLSIVNICHLFNARNLTYLEITHHLPIILTLEDVRDVASAFPHLEGLHLNPKPMYTTETPTRITAVSAFHKTCPCLSSLSLYIQCDGYEAAHTNDSPESPSFVSFGTSHLGEDRLSVLSYLSQILPTHARIVASAERWMSLNPSLVTLLTLQSELNTKG